MTEPWWERWPDRLLFELEALQKAGIRYQVRSQDPQSGILELELECDVNGERLKLQARFPPVYPYTRFEVFAPSLDLPRHQNPFVKNLCLIGRATWNWDVDDTLAAFLLDRLPKVLQAARANDPADAAALEEHQAEPLSAYYPYAPNAIVLVDSAWTIDPAVSQGELVLGVKSFNKSLINAAVLSIRDGAGRRLAEADPAIDRVYGRTTISARWVRALEPIRKYQAREFLRILCGLQSSLERPRRNGSLGADIVGVVFSEETGWRKRGDSWVFLIRVPVERPGFRRGQYWEAHFVRAGRAGRADMGARIPELSALSGRTIAVVGLGCLGAPSAIELAQAGIGELRLMDDDIVEPATVVRWPLGLTAAGRAKTDVLAAFINDNYPFTRVVGSKCRLGGVPGLGGARLDELRQFLYGVDLIYDATAEVGIHYLLTEVAREQRIPYIAVSATPGGWGGRVVRFRPGVTRGCWVCLERFIEEGRIPIAPGMQNGSLQPPGCADPTFAGASFDIGELPLAGVRLAVATLSRLGHESYPDFDWDLAILALRDENGRPTMPLWRTYAVERHPGCENH